MLPPPPPASIYAVRFTFRVAKAAGKRREGEGNCALCIGNVFFYYTRITRNKSKSTGESRLRVQQSLQHVSVNLFLRDLFATDPLTFRDFVAVREKDACKRATYTYFRRHGAMINRSMHAMIRCDELRSNKECDCMSNRKIIIIVVINLSFTSLTLVTFGVASLSIS